jgi:nucleoside-diphosphate-sugar epimerase
MDDFWSKYRNARFLITGASGWFGRTLVDQLIEADIPFVCLGSRNRQEVFSGRPIDILTYDDVQGLGFAPTVLADFAFLTRDKTGVLPPGEYAETNRRLTNQAISLARIDSVQTILTTSSGATVHGMSDSYSQLKLEAEEKFGHEIAGLYKSWVNIRAWSVSGPFVRNFSGYAFSRFVYEAIFKGRISIESPHLVFRRYVDVGDLISVALQLALGGGYSGTIDSGGELLELENLAHRIFGVLQMDPKIDVNRTSPEIVDDYFSRSAQWEFVCRDLGYKPLDLDGQIERLTTSFLNRSQHSPKRT